MPQYLNQGAYDAIAGTVLNLVVPVEKAMGIARAEMVDKAEFIHKPVMS